MPETIEVSPHEAVFERVRQRMQRRLNMTLREAADIANISQFHFHRIFSKWAGKTFKHLLAEYQLAAAQAEMLKGTKLERVAERCGFAHQSHFTSRFKQLTGETPGRWLRKAKQAA